MSKIRVITLLITCLVWPALVSMAQNQPTSHEKDIRRAWDRSVMKILEMARDFPAEKYDASVGGGAQTFKKLIWHATGNVYGIAYRAQGISREEIRAKSREIKEPTDRDGYVAALEKAYKVCAEAVKKKLPVGTASGIEHMGEKYGKLVAIYRANGMVPPRSRK